MVQAGNLFVMDSRAEATSLAIILQKSFQMGLPTTHVVEWYRSGKMSLNIAPNFYKWYQENRTKLGGPDVPAEGDIATPPENEADAPVKPEAPAGETPAPTVEVPAETVEPQAPVVPETNELPVTEAPVAPETETPPATENPDSSSAATEDLAIPKAPAAQVVRPKPAPPADYIKPGTRNPKK